MDKAIYIGVSGATEAMAAQTVHANNLANASTAGFKRSRAVFEDLLYQNQRQPGAQSSRSCNS